MELYLLALCMLSYSSAESSTWAFHFTTVLRMKHVFDVAFITFRYKLYDVLDQDLLEIYYNFIRKNHPHSHAESPVIIIKC